MSQMQLLRSRSSMDIDDSEMMDVNTSMKNVVEKPESNGVTPNDTDVLCGRGGDINSHPGNITFRNLVNSNKRVYLTSRFKREKRCIAERILKDIKRQDPPGRFLTRNSKSGPWYEISEEKARDKTSQALREGAPKLRKQIQAEKEQALNKKRDEKVNTAYSDDEYGDYGYDDYEPYDDYTYESETTNGRPQPPPRQYHSYAERMADTFTSGMNCFGHGYHRGNDMRDDDHNYHRHADDYNYNQYRQERYHNSPQYRETPRQNNGHHWDHRDEDYPSDERDNASDNHNAHGWDQRHYHTTSHAYEPYSNYNHAHPPAPVTAPPTTAHQNYSRPGPQQGIKPSPAHDSSMWQSMRSVLSGEQNICQVPSWSSSSFGACNVSEAFSWMFCGQPEAKIEKVESIEIEPMTSKEKEELRGSALVKVFNESGGDMSLNESDVFNGSLNDSFLNDSTLFVEQM